MPLVVFLHKGSVSACLFSLHTAGTQGWERAHKIVHPGWAGNTGSKRGRVEGCSFSAEQKEVTVSSQEL